MVYNDKEYKQLTFSFNQENKINEIVHTLDHIRIDNISKDPQKIKYAILEMINNSLRAHRENSISSPIIVNFAINNQFLKIQVKDNGRGFDPHGLPYSLNDEVSQINIHSEKFREYQKINNYLRFGMGLYMVKLISDKFELNFEDASGELINWSPDLVNGTTITIYMKNDGEW